jgi:hypothetical protein
LSQVTGAVQLAGPAGAQFVVNGNPSAPIPRGRSAFKLPARAGTNRLELRFGTGSSGSVTIDLTGTPKLIAGSVRATAGNVTASGGNSIAFRIGGSAAENVAVTFEIAP